jgi:hypothetical protein
MTSKIGFIVFEDLKSLVLVHQTYKPNVNSWPRESRNWVKISDTQGNWYFVQNKAHPYIGWPIRWSCWPCWDDPQQITRVEASLSSKFSFSGLTWNMMFYVCSRLEVLWAWWDGPDHSAVMNPCCPGLSVLLPITLTSVPVLLLIMVLQIW